MINEKKEYILDGLCCPNCAAKIEKEVNALPEVKEASLNMINSKLSIAVKDGAETDISGKIHRIVAAHEPDVRVKELTPLKTEEGSMNNSVDRPAADAKKGEKDEEMNLFSYILRLSVSLAAIILFSLLKAPEGLKTVVFVAALLLSGYEVLVTAGKNIRRGKVFDENFLMGIASLGAFIIGEQVEAVSVLIFYGIGELVQDMAVRRSRNNIAGLMDIRPDYANVKSGDTYNVVAPEQFAVGNIILVKPGEKIPLDGIVVSGASFIDTRALTGESVPAEVSEGDSVLSGTINTNGVLEIRVTKSFGESTVSKILELVQNSGSKKAESEKFITKFARYYTPAVVFTAVGVALFPPIFGFGSYATWIYRALSFLIISCPCALVISIPISFFGGIGGAARQGILIKGGNYLDALNQVETIVFDKTGTLTKGVFEVARVVPAEGSTEEELIKLAMVAEYNSTHPIARSLKEYYSKVKTEFNIEKIPISGLSMAPSLEEAAGMAQITEKAGYGMTATIGAGTIYAGNRKLMQLNNIQAEDEVSAGSVVHVAWNDRYLGHILISDEIKPGVPEGIRELMKYGVKHTVMLTGDHKNMAEEIARQCGIEEYHAELLPQNKVELFGQIREKTSSAGKTVFVGDGINDAPVLAGADIGIAMGGIGSDAAIEAADVVIMNDDIGRIATAIKVARKTRTIVMQNIVFALGTKLLIMILAFLGITSIWFAIFADVGVALIALFNAMRAMRVK
jgi:Cd2+/Zn2+-exporting ATPase